LRGKIHAEQGDLKRALEALDEGIALDNEGESYYRNGKCWVGGKLGGDLEAALTECNKSLALREDGDTHDSRGLIYLKQGRFGEARADYDIALKEDPKSASSLFGRGIARRRLDDVAGGNADMAAAKAIDPQIADAYAKYGLTP
jgi:tetratricopeptide (TPR) repeat protein